MRNQSKFAYMGMAAAAGLGLSTATALADRDDVRFHGERHFDRGVHVEVRDRDWRRPEYRDHIIHSHRYGWGPGVGFYFSDGYYYGGCGWLKRRAEEPGDPMWWHRFRRCRDFS